MAALRLSTKLFSIILGIVICISAANARYNLVCEDLTEEDCAFSVSSSGARCVLEKYTNREGSSMYKCQTSSIMAENRAEWIESDECLNYCGLERKSVGLGSDGISQREFLAKLCSPVCANNCPNIFSLFTSLAAGEGVNLGEVCNFLRPSSHRLLAESVVFQKNTDFLIESLSAAAAPVPSPSP